jgi:thiol-disulfide isomerase/thioredoxin
MRCDCDNQPKVENMKNSTIVSSPQPTTADITTKSVPQAKNKLTLFYTNWCGYCRAFLPEWEKVKQSSYPQCDIISIDCDNEKEKCGGVPGFPTLVLETSDGAKTHVKERNSEDIIKMINSLT